MMSENEAQGKVTSLISETVTKGLDPTVEMKDSGVEWIGEIPVGWIITKLKSTISSCIAGTWGDEPNGTADIVCIRVADFDRDRLSILDHKYTLRSVGLRDRNLRLLRKGDLLLEKSGGGDNQPVGAVVCFLKELPAVTSNFVSRLRPNSNGSSGFLTYLHACLYYAKLNLKSIKQTTGIQNLDQAAYLSESIPLPPLPEQQAIADYLDQETARIDLTISKKQGLIELLDERRASLISETVTKGLDPKVEMKDSGVEWIGEIPVGWDRQKIAHAFRQIGSGTTPPTSEYEWYSEDGIAWITTGELRENIVSGTVKCVSPKAVEKFSALRIYPAGSLVIALYGATIGRLGILGIPATTNQACCVMAGEISLGVQFAFYWLLAFKEQIIKLFAEGGGQPNISQETVAAIRIPAPPLPEQQAIADYLDQETARIDKIKDLTKKQIELLKEHRQSLISAVVTGKIRVPVGIV